MRVSKILTLLIIPAILYTSEAKAVHTEDISEQKKTTVYFSAITLYHPIVMYQRYQPLMDYLTKNTPYRFELKLSQDYRDIINFLSGSFFEKRLKGSATEYAFS